MEGKKEGHMNKWQFKGLLPDNSTDTLLKLMNSYCEPNSWPNCVDSFRFKFHIFLWLGEDKIVAIL